MPYPYRTCYLPLRQQKNRGSPAESSSGCSGKMFAATNIPHPMHEGAQENRRAAAGPSVPKRAGARRAVGLQSRGARCSRQLCALKANILGISDSSLYKETG